MGIGDDGIGTLEQNGAARPSRRFARGIDLGIGRADGGGSAKLFENIGEQPPELPLMGREDASVVE